MANPAPPAQKLPPPVTSYFVGKGHHVIITNPLEPEPPNLSVLEFVTAPLPPPP